MSQKLEKLSSGLIHGKDRTHSQTQHFRVIQASIEEDSYQTNTQQNVMLSILFVQRSTSNSGKN